MNRFKAWETSLAPEIKEAFFPLTRAVNNWMPEIMAYFDHPVTNAYTESLNKLIRVMNRLGRGYSFEALRAKILFTEGVKPKFQKPVHQEEKTAYFNMSTGFSKMTASTREPEQEINYGADISTLVKMIEEGRL